MLRFALVGLLAAAGCGGPAGPVAGPRGAGPYRIVATTGMVADLVKAVAGPQAEVTTLFGDTVDPHTYKLLPADRRALEEADMVFASGLHLEGRMTEYLESLGQRKPTVLLGATLPGDRLLRDAAGTPDPHVWMDADLWRQALPAIRDALAKFDPGGTEGYSSRAAAADADLVKLHAEIAATLGALPKERRVMVTAHDAFRYYGRAYGVEVRGLQGISTDSEIGTKDLADLVELIVARRIGAVFVEASVSDKNLRALIAGCQARGHAVRVGGQMYSDTLGPAGGPAASYAGMLRHNTATLMEAMR